MPWKNPFSACSVCGKKTAPDAIHTCTPLEPAAPAADVLPVSRTRWLHRKSGNVYEVQSIETIKLDGHWVSMVAYVSSDGQRFHRLVPDFFDSFQEL